MAQQTIFADEAQPRSGPNLGDSTEEGDSWGVAVAKLNAMMADLYGGAGGTVYASRSVAINGAAATQGNTAIYFNETLTGTATDATQGRINLYFRDEVDAGDGLYCGLYLRQAYGGSGSKGSRFALYSYFSIDQIPNAGDTSIQNYTSGTFQAYANAVAKTGLTGGATYAGYAGALWGSDFNVWVGTNCQNWLSIRGIELGVSIYTPGSAADRFGAVLYAGGDTQGAIDDAGLVVANAGKAFRTAIQFGGQRQNCPIDSTGTFIGAVSRVQGGSSNAVALYGIDFSAATFSAGGAPLLSSFITPASSGATGKAGSIVWDTGYIYVCTATNTWKRAALSTF